MHVKYWGENEFLCCPESGGVKEEIAYSLLLYFVFFLIIEGEVWNVKAEVKAMNLRTGSRCFGGYRWNSSTQDELVTSSDHVHYSCIPSVSDSYRLMGN